MSKTEKQVEYSFKIKVCGMRNADNIHELAQLPIDYIGFIFYPKSSRFVSEKPAIKLPDSIKKTGVFVNESVENILVKAREYELDCIQLHGEESFEFCKRIKTEGYQLIKAFGIDDTFDWQTLVPYLISVDYFLFDTKTPKHGGSGLSFNWEKLKEYPYDKPYFLSGGLSVENIKQASLFEDNRLIGLDLNSKFEIEPGVKNINLLTQALKILKK